MIDHISLKVRDFDRAVDFYKAALAPLGYELLMSFPGVAGFGANKKPDLWIAKGETVVPTHVAIAATRPAIDAFHAAALAAGGADNGPPGLRPMYHPDYYGAFVHDHDGNNIEAVSHAPPGAAKKAPARKAAKKAKAAKKVAKKAAKAEKKATKKGAKKKAAKKASKR
jgi:catechol 2,3-dioxygenase-like lactoylglutathione lyase family enzyme